MNEGKRYTGFLESMEERVEIQKFYFQIKYNLINCLCIKRGHGGGGTAPESNGFCDMGLEGGLHKSHF